MKTRKRLKLTLMILICILISLVGFIGIYTKETNRYSNILPSYQLASDLKGATILELEVDDTTETVYYDSEGNEVESTEVTDENKDEYTSEDVKVNPEDVLTEENYEKTVKILKDRLEFLQAEVQMVPSTYIKLDEKDGEKMQRLIDNLEDLDDVMNVYHNWEE